MRNKRILKNTLVLYARQFTLILINLYTLRVLLNALGIEGFGIYTVVAGIVALASFLPASMSYASQRYFSFALGQNDQTGLQNIFVINIIIYLGLGVFSILVLESAGLWFVYEKLNIPLEKVESARILYQISIFTFLSSLFASPFMAIIVAHEEIEIYAYVSLFEAVAKMIAVISITLAPWERLISYGTFLLLASVTTTAIYIVICKKRYPECTFKNATIERPLLRNILSFTGWTLFGQLTTVARNQAVTILLHQAFNPAVAAARAIAVTVAVQVSVFAAHFNTSLCPPIIKHYSANQKEDMFTLLFQGSKLTFFLMWIFALPLYFEMETILTLWLVHPPPEAIYFSQLALIEALIVAISLPLTTAARAPGQMRLYELSLGTIQLLILIVSWILLKYDYPASSVFIVAIAANLIMFFIRLFIVSNLLGLRVSDFLNRVAIPAFVVSVTSAVPSIALKESLPSELLASILVIIFSTGLTSLSMYYFGIDLAMRNQIKQQMRTVLARFS